MDYGNGGCCIARWTDEGRRVSKMDMIMLKYRPIAPKPVSENGSMGATSDSNNNSPCDGRHAKQAIVKGRRKSGTTTKKCNTTTTSGKKRKPKSSESQIAESSSLDLDHRDGKDHDDQDLKGEATLLPLFPEAPDLSPTKQSNNNNPTWLNINSNININNYYYYNNDNIMTTYDNNKDTW